MGTISTPLLLEALKASLSAQTEVKKTSLMWFLGQSAQSHSLIRGADAAERSFLSEYFDIFDFEDERIQGKALEALDDNILILEGFYSADPNDPSFQVLKNLSARCKVVILLGNEACYHQTPEGYLELEREILYPIGRPFLKIPGEPAQFFHLLGVLNHLILYGLPELDEFRRPSMFFSNVICESCRYRKDFEAGNFLDYPGQRPGCLYQQGCKGPYTKNSCSVQGFNQKSGWCVEAGSPCTGCSEPSYPNHFGMGMYGQMSGEQAEINAFWLRHSKTLAVGAIAAAGTGIALHALSRKGAQTPTLSTPSNKKSND